MPTSDGPMIYSPSQTENWLRCPVLWRLRKEGWRRRQAGKRELAAILGSAISAGLAHYNLTKMHMPTPGGEVSAEPASLVARAEALTLLRDMTENGISVGEWDQAQRDAIPERARKAILSYHAHDPIPPEWRRLHVEQELLDYGRARIDLGVDDGVGPAVVDYKTKLTLDKRYERRDFQRWEHSWQQRHYLVGYGQFLGRPVLRYYICLLVLEPRFQTELFLFSCTPEYLERWETHARAAWDVMTYGPIWEAASHADEFGVCEYKDACFEDQLDPGAMRQHYVCVKGPA